MTLRDVRAKLIGAGLELRKAVVSGATPNADIAVAGLKRTSVLVSVLEFQPPTATAGNAIVAERVGVASVPQDGVLRVNADTSGNQLLVEWWD